MLKDHLHLTRSKKDFEGDNGLKKTPIISLMCTSRNTEALNIGDKIAEAFPEFLISKKLISNGHCDPLYGLDKDNLPDLVVFIQNDLSCEEEFEEYANRPVDQRPPMIVIGHNERHEAMRWAMKAGARDFLTEPVEFDELTDSIAHIVDEILKSGRESGANIVAVMNTKGGSGASLLASNISHILSVAMEQRVVLIDLDLQFGSPGQYLDLSPKRGLIEALQMIDELDEFSLEGYLLSHESGLRVISAENHELLYQDDTLGARIEMLLDLLAKTYDQIIVDIPRHIDALTTTVLERADKVLLVTQQSVTHLSDASRLMRILCQDLQIDKSHIIPIINRYQKNSEITFSDIEKAFRGLSPVVVANDFERVNDSLNNGIPLYTFARTALITKELTDLSAELGGMAVPGKKSLIERLRARL